METGKIAVRAKCTATLIAILIFGNACTTKPESTAISEPFPQQGFCDLSDEELRKFVIELNIIGVSSSTAAATFLGG